MYDKLGKLLSDALDSGFISKEEKKSTKENFSEQNQKENSQKSEQKKTRNAQENYNSYKLNQNFYKEEREQKNHQDKDYEIIKFIPKNVKIAFAEIKIPEDATFEEAKKIYHEKLKYYHPDTRNENPVLQKVAKEKTEILLANWKIIEEYYKSDSDN